MSSWENIFYFVSKQYMFCIYAIALHVDICYIILILDFHLYGPIYDFIS